MITRELLEKGYDLGAVRLISSPHGDGTVCQIGGYWFYFGGQTAEEMEPEEYRRNVPKADIMDEILVALEGIRDDLSEDEYNYYECVLLEAESSLDIRHLCYELYKEHWLSENVTFEEKRQALKEYYCEYQNEVSFDTYIEDQGYHGSLYVCYDEFLGAEYLMKDFVKELLDDEQLYDVYLKDMGNLISE